MARPVIKDGFTGWPREVYDFFDGLIEDNSRTWFQANRADYENNVRAPMERLLAECESEFGAGHIFRPNRDVRFSKDKRPYKENIGATAGRASGPTYYVHLDGEGLFVGTGYYMMAPDQIARYRLAVADDKTGTPLTALVSALRRAHLEVGISDLQRVPRPYPPDHPQADLLKHKSLIASRRWAQPDWLHTKRALAEVTKVWRAARDLNGWLESHVGPSTAVDRWGGTGRA